MPPLFAPYESYVDTGVLTEIPYLLFPKDGALIPFGTTENSNCLNWLANGDPEGWRIVIWEPDYLEFFDSGYTSLLLFLHDVVLQKSWLYADASPLDWFDSPRAFTAIDFDAPEWQTT